MLSVQLGSALSLDLVQTVGPAATAWLRLTVGAAVFVLIARPPRRSIRRVDVPVLLVLGVTTGLVTIAFLAAIERIPLSTAVAIEFLGPVTVAAVRSASGRFAIWPALALLGVIFLVQPWRSGAVDLGGVTFALLAGAGWGTYIVLTQRVGARLSGLGGLAFTIPVAAITTAVVGIPQARGNLTTEVVAIAAGLALLVPVLPFALELLALRRMTQTAFGTLMAIEPALAVVLGQLVLSQVPSVVQLFGVSLVVVAGAGAQRDGRRGEPPCPRPT